MELYFAYGSNMRSTRLTRRVGPVRVLGAVQLAGWALRFDKPGRDGTGKANLVRAAATVAWGVAYALPDAAWPELDRFEPGYERVRVRVEPPAGSPLDAQVYLYPAPVVTAARAATPARHLAPSDDYVTHLIEGALEHGLPADYLERIRSAARGE